MSATILVLYPRGTPATARPDPGRTPRPHRLRIWIDRIRARRALAALHPEQIRDAGLDADMVRAEMAKPFWRR